MKIRQCRCCVYFSLANFHSGFTGKGGQETWNKCMLKRQYLREIKKCEFAIADNGGKRIVQPDTKRTYHADSSEAANG